MDVSDNKTYKVHIHETPYRSKPTNIPSINETITDEQIAVTQRRFAELVGEQGHTTVLGLMNGRRKKENLITQQVVAVDFDNTVIKNGQKTKATGHQYTSIEDILNDKFAKEQGSFIYKTFSYKDNWHRFRLVFFLDEPLTHNKQVEYLYKWLMDKYPNADGANKDSSRLFFGGFEVIEINFGNELYTRKVEVKESSSQSNDATAAVPNNVNKPPQKIPNEEARALLNDYIERERENLQDYNNALSALWVIGKAAKTGEISPVMAHELAEKLAMGNSEWRENNKIKLQECLNKPLHDIHTDYTFAGKFGYQYEGGAEKDDLIATSKYLVDQLELKLYKGKIYFKQENYWLNDKNKLLRAVDQYIELKASQDKELLHQFQKRATLVEKEDFPIQLRNDYMIEGGEIVEGSSKEFTPYYLDVKYDPDAYNKTVDNFLNFLTCDRQDLRQVVEDMLGHVLMTSGFPHKVFFFIGEKGANGKSTFLEMLNNFSGDLGTNISLENFNDGTSVVELEGHLVNIGDDIDANYLESSSNFKILASGNTVMTRPIYSEPYRLKNKATLIFTANDMPTFKDKTGGIARRLVIIPCDNVVKKADFSIDEKLSTNEAKSYLLNLALTGLDRIKKNGGQISSSKTIHDRVKEYFHETNSIVAFIDEEGIDENLTDRQNYTSYKNFCDDYELKPFSKTKFTQFMKDHGYDHVREQRLGKRNYYYRKVDEE